MGLTAKGMPKRGYNVKSQSYRDDRNFLNELNGDDGRGQFQKSGGMGFNSNANLYDQNNHGYMVFDDGRNDYEGSYAGSPGVYGYDRGI